MEVATSAKDEILRNREKLFARIQWEDWRSQLQNRVKGADLEKYFVLSEDEQKGIQTSVRLNVGTTPYYLSLADPFDPECPIRKIIVPRSGEGFVFPEESPDPLHEERLSPVKGLTHMYPDRVLLFSNHDCAVFCRHCMRGRKVSDGNQRMTSDEIQDCMDYIAQHSEISDVVVSGGDPTNLSTNKLVQILQSLNAIPHVKICRIGTRNPVTLPFRFDTELLSALEEWNSDDLSIFCNTQFNHEKECTPEAKKTVLNILKAGISVGNQCVILKGINDSGPKMLALHRKLLELRIRAYYMYDPEIIPGSRHFRTPLKKGIEIVEFMRGKIAGMGIPQFVNDLPGGGGKITLSPNWYLGFHKESGIHVFRSAIRGTYHLSSEPPESEYRDEYPEISSEEWELISRSAGSGHDA